MYLLFVLLIGVSIGFTPRETLDMKMQCRNICLKNKSSIECQKACLTAMEHRVRNFPNLPEELKKFIQPAVAAAPQEQPKKMTPSIHSARFVKPGRQNFIRK
jgi:hypothetical protein